MQGHLTGLPDFLAPRQGLAENSLGEFGVTAQGLTAEARRPMGAEIRAIFDGLGLSDPFWHTA